MPELSLASYGVIERPASAADVAVGYAAKVGDPIMVDAESGAFLF